METLFSDTISAYYAKNPEQNKHLKVPEDPYRWCGDSAIFPNTQEAIISQAQCDRVQDGKSNREAQEKSIKADKKRLEQAKKRLSDLDVIMSKLYEDHAPDKSTGKRQQKLKIIFNFVDEVEIPAIAKPIVYKRSQTNRKTA